MTPSKLSAWCNGIIEAGWIAALVIAPLYFNGYTSTVIEPDKLALIRALASVMLAASFVRWLDQSRASQISIAHALRAPFVLPVLLILAVALLSTLTSIAPRISFFGAYHRPQGFTALIAYLIIFALMCFDLRTRAQLDRVIVAITLTSLPIALYAAIQKLGFDPLLWRGEFAGRVAATMGNPIFLGAYLAMIFPLTASQVVRYARAPRNALAACAYAIILIAQAVAIFFTASRGPWLGWFAGIALFGLLLALLLRQRRFIFGAIGLSALALAFLVALNLPDTPLAPLRAIPGLNRLGYLADSTGEFRLFTWENSARLVALHAPLQFPDGAPDPFNVVRPLLGYGFDTMGLTYFQVSPPSPYGAEFVTDHSHNETWDVLVTTGFAGLIAYQIFYLAIFFYGLRWLGFLETTRAQKMFIALWIGLGALGALSAILVGQSKYVGLTLPLGNITAILVSLVYNATRKTSSTELTTERVLIAALLAGFCAHYIESQFGIAVVATRVLEWTFAGILIALGARQIETRAPQSTQSFARIGALILGVILATILFSFMRFTQEASDPLTIFWRALIFSPAQNDNSAMLLVLMLATWLVGIAMMVSSTWRADLIALCIAPVATIVLVGGGLALQWSAVAAIALPVTRLDDVATFIAVVTGLVDFYALIVFIWIGLVAWLLPARPLPNVWCANRWSMIAFAPVALVAFVWINAIDLDPIRAEVAYRAGKLFDEQEQWDAASVSYQHALARAPLNDAYYMAFGRALQNQSRAADPAARAQFTGDTRLDQILARDFVRAPKLNRVDFLFAAQKMLLRARELNPLYSDHTTNLAHFYAPELPVNTEGKRKLADLSSEYYAQASRLIPNDARLWNDWAEFELTYRENADAALSKLQESARRDPQFAPTFVQMGDLYKAQANFAQAIIAYQRALAAKNPPPEVASKLAFVYYQQGNFAAAMQNYLRFIELAPRDEKVWEARKNLALIYKQTGDLRAAIQQAELARALAPNDAKAQLNELINQWRAQ